MIFCSTDQLISKSRDPCLRLANIPKGLCNPKPFDQEIQDSLFWNWLLDPVSKVSFGTKFKHIPFFACILLCRVVGRSENAGVQGPKINVLGIIFRLN